MTDARFPEKWLNDRRILRLTPAYFRAFVMSLAWSVSNRTDGRLEPADLPLVPGFEAGAAEALEACGLWTVETGGWRIADFTGTQTTAAQLQGLDHKRAVDRERQARKRAHDAGNHVLCLSDNCTMAAASGDSSLDVTRDQKRDTKDRTGQARTGKAFNKEALEKDESAPQPDIPAGQMQSQRKTDEAWLAYKPVPVGPASVAVART
jgi:hypothetical protein